MLYKEIESSFDEVVDVKGFFGSGMRGVVEGRARWVWFRVVLRAGVFSAGYVSM